MKIWKFYYGVMSALPSRFLQRSFWFFLRKMGISKCLCDEGFLKLQLLSVTGEKYDICGGGVNSKILWQRLYNRTPLWTTCCDKYAVREFVKSRIGEAYLTPLLPHEGAYWTNADEVDFEALPNEFVLKLNTGSGMNLLVWDKAKLDIAETRHTLKEWLASEYSSSGREWQYKDVPKKILCESMIRTSSGEAPRDYKFMCSNGKVLYVWVDIGRFSSHSRNIYSPDWVRQDVQISFVSDPLIELKRPKNFDVMLEIAQKLLRSCAWIYTMKRVKSILAN